MTTGYLPGVDAAGLVDDDGVALPAGGVHHRQAEREVAWHQLLVVLRLEAQLPRIIRSPQVHLPVFCVDSTSVVRVCGGVRACVRAACGAYR